MTRHRWSDAFAVRLAAAPVVVVAAGIGLVLAGGAGLAAIGAWASARGFDAVAGVAAVVLAASLGWGIIGWLRYRRAAVVIEVAAGGNVRVDGVQAVLSRSNWSSGAWMGLRFECGDGRARRVLIAPGAAPADDLRRLRTFLRWRSATPLEADALLPT